MFLNSLPIIIFSSYQKGVALPDEKRDGNMAPSHLMQVQAFRTALQLVSKRSCNAALRQRLTDVGVPKTGGRLFHTTVKK